MTAPIATFTFSDGKQIPWLGWGNGTGEGKASNQATLPLVLDAFGKSAHLDTAQNYGSSEKTTGEVLAELKPERSSFWLTTKLSNATGGKEGVPGAPATEVAALRDSVKGSLERLGTKPDLLLIHNPYVVPEGQLKEFWQELEALVEDGTLGGVSLGVSNFRPEELEYLLSFAKLKPVVNQIEFHPWTLVHSQPLLAIHEKHNIITEAYGPLVPLLKAKTGGALKPVLDRIAAAHDIEPAAVLLLWVRAKGAVAVSSSGSADRIKKLAETARLPATLTAADVSDIDAAGSKTHYRFYAPHLTIDFPAPDLPEDI